jgi:predicted AlkP superfamily phosphohydrolase/phosphomutase
MSSRRGALALLLVALFAVSPAEAYIGPGAGFAFVGSFFLLLWAIVLALFTAISYPLRLLWRALARRPLPPGAPRRTIIVGFDGMDPNLAERWMAEGKLPNFAALAAEGAFRRLETTHPPLSPVAWSSFMTGVHPARHGIFDFLARDTRSYLPFLSSSSVEPARRALAIGKFQLPLGRPRIRAMRKALPFWKILGERGVFCTVVRVPVTFPPEKFRGVCLSGMSVPDLRGSQGSFTCFSEDPWEAARTGGMNVTLRRDGRRLLGSIPGPEHPFRRDGSRLEIPLVVELRGNEAVRLCVGRERVELRPGTYSDWVPLKFRAAPGIEIRGIARFRIVSLAAPFALYMTPIHIDPERPSLPISHPRVYAPYLAKLLGPFATLGLAEDTWALNERVLDEEGFLEQVYLIHAERERQLFDALEKTRRGVVVCVFDATDRIQHMFYRYADPDPRAERPGDRARYARAIEEAYVRMDELLGRIRRQVDDRSVLLVLSDHGFASFRRGVNLNAWLAREGYLALVPGRDGTAEYLRDVDWSRTRAYAVGLAGIYVNQRGREARGIVAPGEETEQLKRELAARLAALTDPENGRPVVRRIVDLSRHTRGPYLDQAPDLVVGWADGYRVSWDAAVGRVAGEVVADNPKSWSGDHCVDPSLVPGVLFSNRPIAAERPSIVDLAPTVLRLYGIEPPRYMEGTPLGIDVDPGPAPSKGRSASRNAAATLLVLCSLLLGCRAPIPGGGRELPKVVVLGFDGLDPDLLEQFVAAGELPNFARLAQAAGGIHRLATTMPPQSPVAWSTFVTGQDPGGHGIFDFIHRDPSPPEGLALRPYLSTSRVEEDDGWRLPLGPYALPLSSGKAELLRRGRAFWNLLADRGIPATIVKIPANFPPEPSRARTLSDMGTPDLRGTYGTFFLFTSDPEDGDSRNVSGGVIQRVRVEAGRVRASLPGPRNPFLADSPRAERRFDIWVDPDSDAAKIDIGDGVLVLRSGEWSPWTPVSFDLIPGLVRVSGIVRFHLIATKPHFRLYTTPVNIDPSRPALPISTPASYARELFDRIGYYYTQGLPEETAALAAGALDDGSFLAQARDIYEERLGMLEVELERFQRGLLFVYFGGSDLVSHMFWRGLEPGHPSGGAPGHEGAIRDVYRQMDAALGRALAAVQRSETPAVVIALSDHGFASFRRAAHLNSWLRDQGYLRLRPGASVGRELFADVDWSRTRAYGLGLNGLYLNLEGREKYGIVRRAERDALAQDIAAKLLQWRDPETGEPVVARVYRAEEIYSEAHRDQAPDLVVGYSRGYRVSDASALGEVPEPTIEDNRKKWSGDHCIAFELVPGVVLSNRPIESAEPALVDVAPTILALFGVPAPPEMKGRPFLH